MTDAIQVGKKQAIAPWVANIQPDKTPFLSSLKQGKRPLASLMTWQAEQYGDQAFDGVLDGSPVTTFEVQGRELITGCVQQFRQSWKVTKRAEITDVAGIGRAEAARQKVIAVLQLKRQIERMYCSATVPTAESGATPFRSWGAIAALSNTLAQTGSYPIPSAVLPDAATNYTSAIASFTESSLKTIFEAAYAAKKGELDLVGFCGVTLRGIIDDFTGVLKSSSSTSQPRTIYRVQGNAVFMNKVTDIEFSTGRAMLITSPFLACTIGTGAISAYSPNTGIFVDPALWDDATMSPIASEDLPVDGSGPRGFVEAFKGLRPRNPLGQGLVYTNS